jgi:hypothetical protein
VIGWLTESSRRFAVDGFSDGLSQPSSLSCDCRQMRQSQSLEQGYYSFKFYLCKKLDTVNMRHALEEERGEIHSSTSSMSM